MPNINVYLDDYLYDYVKDNKSKIIQDALRLMIEKDAEDATRT